MSRTFLNAGATSALLTVILAGCGSGKTSSAASEPDPIQEKIETKVKKQGPKEVPPGYIVNSGGELVPANDTAESDQ